MENTLWVSMPIIQNIVMGTGYTPHEIDVICQSGGITRIQLEDSGTKLSLQQNCAIMETALAISDNKTLGLHVGEKTSPVVLGITGHLMQSSKDLLTALENLQQYTGVFTRLYNFYMEIKQDDVYYFCEPLEVWNNISPETARQSVDIAYAGALHILFLLTGKSIFPKKVMYRYTRVVDTSEYVRVFKSIPFFNEPCNCIVFSLTDLRTPIIGHNRELTMIFKNLLEEEIKKESGSTFTSEVKQLILRNFQSSFPQLEEIAIAMHMTPRTLQRKLKEENNSFRSLTDSIKQELACNLLKNKQLSIAEVAYKLGYAEPSTFQRAFRQWMGQSPKVFRRFS